ncbi:STAS domain-containing protein [Mycobacterium sp. NPDC006124]|uniref:STAS domain-containing protein n=1 Tax=Mycobacterium sp. NPDC006124 TaxID=3156729 RepID=UPI0033AEF6FD
MSLAPRISPDPPGLPRERVRFATSATRSPVLVVSAEGEVDAANALLLGKYVEAELESASRLVVDLRELEFFAVQGFSILHRINVMCSRHAVNWVVLAGTEVNRVLRVCDPDGGLPVADTMEAAIATVTRPPRSHLRLVTSR